MNGAILIAGPTASGKSALAVEIAEACGGVVINADSMQVYGVLDVMTARPQADDLARVPHRLFGHVPPANVYSTGYWLKDVEQVLATGLDGRTPVFVGGTGLYFRALTGGLSPMPDVPNAIREHWRAKLAAEGAAPLHAVLADRDPEGAASLRASDSQRVLRALEVLDASGLPISHWQKQPGTALISEATARKIVLEPERKWLANRIRQRLGQMASEGGLEEVQRLLALGIDPAMPAMKAIGVREFGAVLAGTSSLDDSLGKAAAATRQYAKRQMTWFRNQLDDSWERRQMPG